MIEAETAMAESQPEPDEKPGPIMTLEEVASHLKVSQKTILRMVRSGQLPGAKVSNQWRFVKSAIDDWLMSRMQGLPSEHLTEVVQATGPLPDLPYLITPNRILLELTPGSPENILSQLMRPLVDEGTVTRPEHYLEALLERERMAATAIGAGVAIPHARHPERAGLRENAIVLGLSQQGTDFGALDGARTHVFFLIASMTTESHLRLMARTMLLWRAAGVHDSLMTATSIADVRAVLMQHRATSPSLISNA